MVLVSILLFLFVIPVEYFVLGFPLPPLQARRPGRQVRFHQNSDGSFTASIAQSQAINIPGQGTANFGVAENFNFGPQGSSFDGGQSFNSDFGGNKVAYGSTNSQNSRQGPLGFSSSGGNSASNSFQNPFFQSSNAQANAFGNQFNQVPFQRNF